MISDDGDDDVHDGNIMIITTSRDIITVQHHRMEQEFLQKWVQFNWSFFTSLIILESQSMLRKYSFSFTFLFFF
jgi:hypothetical protein